MAQTIPQTSRRIETLEAPATTQISGGHLVAKEGWDHSCWAKTTVTTHESALGCKEKSDYECLKPGNYGDSVRSGQLRLCEPLPH